MKTGQGVSGMCTMNQSMFNAYMQRKISLEEAMTRSPDPAELQQMMETRSANAR